MLVYNIIDSSSKFVIFPCTAMLKSHAEQVVIALIIITIYKVEGEKSYQKRQGGLGFPVCSAFVVSENKIK